MESLKEFIKKHQVGEEKTSTFVSYLYSLMDKYKINNPSDLYSKANISRQLWSSIISNKSNPSLNVCIKIALTLKVNNHECKYLLKKSGYTLASSNTYALIIRYAVENKLGIIETNDLLEQNGYKDSLLV